MNDFALLIFGFSEISDQVARECMVGKEICCEKVRSLHGSLPTHFFAIIRVKEKQAGNSMSRIREFNP